MQFPTRHRSTVAILAVGLLVFAIGCENNSDTRSEAGDSGTGFSVAPSAVSLGTPGDVIVLAVSGGAPPFTWTVSEATLGTITGLDGNNQTRNQLVNYRPTAGMMAGVNTVTVQDTHGNRANATITHPN